MSKDPDSSTGESPLSSGWSVVEPVTSQPATEPREAVRADVTVESDDAVHEVSNLALVLFGVFGGMYLLYTVGWFLIAQYFSTVNDLTASTSGVIGGVLQQVLFWFACLAPPAWFVAVVVLTRQRAGWRLPAGLILGLIVLLPLPLFTVGGGSS